MMRWLRLGISFGWIAVLCGWLPNEAAAAELIKVRIVTRTNDNMGVNVKIERRKNGGAWKDAEVTPKGMGIYERFEDVCDESVEYRAISTKSFLAQIAIRQVKCTFPEVVFADFYVTASNLIERFTDENSWMLALGGVENAEGYARAYATQVRLDYANADYGKIAILGSEIASQLRTAGKPQDAEVFAALSVDATVRGVAARRSLQLDNTKVLVYDPVADQVVLSEQAKSVVQAYQTENLGFAKTAPTLGKADWKTMRSLDGGQTVLTYRIRLPDGAISDFNTEPFLSVQ